VTAEVYWDCRMCGAFWHFGRGCWWLSGDFLSMRCRL